MARGGGGPRYQSNGGYSDKEPLHPSEEALLKNLTNAEQRARAERQGGAAGAQMENGQVSDHIEARVPTCIEEAPLRRQDRRVLNAVRRRRADRRLIACIIVTSLAMAGLGGAAISVWVIQRGNTGPFLVAGSVIVACGLAFLLASIELCLRLRRESKRVRDPKLFRTKNLHEVKHWIEPGKSSNLGNN